MKKLIGILLALSLFLVLLTGCAGEIEPGGTPEPPPDVNVVDDVDIIDEYPDCEEEQPDEITQDPIDTAVFPALMSVSGVIVEIVEPDEFNEFLMLRIELDAQVDGYTAAVTTDANLTDEVDEDYEPTDFELDPDLEFDFGQNVAYIVVHNTTLFPFDTEFNVGDMVTAWYNTNAPMIMIYPPRYNAEILAVNAPEEFRVAADRFTAWEGGQWLSQDGMFAFSIGEDTEVFLTYGALGFSELFEADEFFIEADIEGQRVIVLYGMSTRSIPEMAVATKIIIMVDSPYTWDEIADMEDPIEEHWEDYEYVELDELDD